MNKKKSYICNYYYIEKKMKVCLLAIIIVLFAFSLSVHAKIIVVGNCENGNQNYSTIADALSNAQSGDDIKICPGRYREGDLQISVDNITIESTTGNPNDVTISNGFFDSYVFYATNWIKSLVIKGITIDSALWSIAVYIGNGAKDLEFSDLYINSKDGGVYVDGYVSNAEFDNSTFDTRYEGVNFSSSVNNAYFYDVNMQSGRSNCIYITKSSGNIIVATKGQTNNSFYCKNTAIYLGNEWGNYDIENSDITTTAKNSAGIAFKYGNSLNVQNVSIDASSKGSGIWSCYNNAQINSVDIENSIFKNIKYENICFSTINTNITIKGNELNGGNYGIYIKKGWPKGNIERNIISNMNDYGVYLFSNEEWTKGIDINHNCFENNINSAYVYDHKSVIDSNYWSDYASSGAYSIPPIPLYDNNPLQTCPVNPLIEKPLINYRMDECRWDNDSNTYEVWDSEDNDNATSVNGANTVTDGVLCKSAKFIGGYIELQHTLYLGRRWSLSFWLKFPLNPTPNQFSIGNYYYFIIGSVEGTGDLGYFKKSKTSNDYWFGVYDNNGRIKEFKIGSISNGWHYFAMVKQNSKTTLYMNGTYEGKVYAGTSGNLIYIGTSTDYSDNETVGSDMDEVKVWDSALTQEEIKTIYNNEKNGLNYNGTDRVCPICEAVNHYEIIHNSSGLTCQPSDITVKACSNDNCSVLYTNAATVTMTPSGWIGGDTHNFTGGSVVLQFSRTTPGTVELGMNSETPVATYCCRNSAIDNNCVKDAAHCDITFYNSGFIFYVPNQISCKPSDNISVEAVRLDETTRKCIPAFANVTKKIDFWFAYKNPTTGTKQLYLKGNTQTNFSGISSDNATPTPVELAFDSNGVATVKLKYADAGELGLHAEYDNTTSGLIMKGESVFIIKPWAFYIDIPGNPAAQDANGAVFTQAGKPFLLSVRAVCWQANDNISNNDDLSDNLITRNFRDNVTISHSLVAPIGGDESTLGVTNFDIVANGEKTDNETFGEVGIISLKAEDDNYLGAGAIDGKIPFVGRFIPDHFSITAKTNGALAPLCTTFNYTGALTTYSIQPSFVITAQNMDNNTTLNYTGAFFKLTDSDISITTPTTDDKQIGKNGNKVAINIVRAQPLLKDNTNGTSTYIFGYDNVTYVKDNNSKIGPFSPQFTFKIDNITDSDNVSAVELPDNITVDGLSMRYGRLKIFDNYAPETENLKIHIETQFWDGTYWKQSSDDSCTTLVSSNFILDNFTGNLSSGETHIIDSSVYGISYGVGGFTLEAPGESNYGTVNICLSDNASFYNYLNNINTCGTATFGIYRGRDRIIEWKEVPAQ